MSLKPIKKFLKKNRKHTKSHKDPSQSMQIYQNQPKSHQNKSKIQKSIQNHKKETYQINANLSKSTQITRTCMKVYAPFYLCYSLCSTIKINGIHKNQPNSLKLHKIIIKSTKAMQIHQNQSRPHIHA